MKEQAKKFSDIRMCAHVFGWIAVAACALMAIYMVAASDPSVMLPIGVGVIVATVAFIVAFYAHVRACTFDKQARWLDYSVD